MCNNAISAESHPTVSCGPRPHDFALASPAPVNVQLHGLDDGVVVGEVLVVSHAADSRIDEGGASTDKSGQRRTGIIMS